MSDKPIAIVIDDEAQIRKLLRLVLVEKGYDAIEADTGKSGLAEIATRRPDVVLLDLGLPDMNGIEVLKRLREWSHVPAFSASTRKSPYSVAVSLTSRPFTVTM